MMFEDMFYEHYFTAPSEAEQIIQKAVDDLQALLTEEEKAVINEAASSKEELSNLKSEIREKKQELTTIEGQIAKAKQRAEEAELHEIPRKYINRFVRDEICGFAPGDTVWIITDNSTWDKCPICCGVGKINANVGETKFDVQCPKCGGFGRILIKNRVVKERKISSIHLSCHFSAEGQSWATGNIYLDGSDYAVALETLYKTHEDAEAALEKKNKEDETNG